LIPVTAVNPLRSQGLTINIDNPGRIAYQSEQVNDKCPGHGSCRGEFMPAVIALRPGETYTLALEGRGSAGYSWSYTVSGDRNAVEVRIEGLRESPHISGGRPAAGSVQEQLVVTAVSLGAVFIELAQRRSWEKDQSPLAQQTVVISVH
jgi:predicted secreted protein